MVGVVKTAGDAVIISVRVVPRAGRAGIAGTRHDAVLIRLNAPPVDGAANAELIDVLAGVLDVPKRSVTIIGGERSRLKRVRVEGIGADQALERLNLNQSPITNPQSTRIKNH